MAGKSQTQADTVLNILRGTNVTAPTSVYVSLFSAAPASDSADGTELSGNGYARQAITFGAPAADTGGTRKITNTSVITFGPASADWLTATHFGIHSAISGASNLLYWDALTASKLVQNLDSAQFAVGTLVAKED